MKSQSYSMKSNREEEVEKYLELINKANANEQEYNTDKEPVNTVNNLQDVYLSDLAKCFQKCTFTYEPKTSFPISFLRDKILTLIETNSVVAIQGPMGCGKSTQIPQIILDYYTKRRLHCNIIVTQPRRIAAINIAKRVCEEGRWELGSVVGYKVGLKKKVSHETRLTYCTTEVLLNLLIQRKHMLDYTHVILDEIHERDQNLDFLLLLVKKLLQTNSSMVKIILMSATFDVAKFTTYFSSRMRNQLVPAPFIRIPDKKIFVLNIYYLDQIENLGAIPNVTALEPKVSQPMINFCSRILYALDMIDANDNIKKASASKITDARHAVLVFLPGLYEIEEIYNFLSSEYHQNKLWELVILHSLVSSSEQERIFRPIPQGYRRIILSTNVAESSITVPDVKYVIDFCLVKLLVLDPITKLESLQLCWASKANCAQRAGRAGRVMDGRVYRLVPKSFYDNILENESIPEMLRAPLENTILRAKVLDLCEPRALLSYSLDPPDIQNLERTVLTLKEIGGLVEENCRTPCTYDGVLTGLGRVMAALPLDVRVSKLIMLGHAYDVVREAIILAASMAVKDLFTNKCRQTVAGYAVRRKWAGDFDSDCMACLNVYRIWQNEKANRRLNAYPAERQWAQRNEIDLKVLHELDALVHEITDRLRLMGIAESAGTDKVPWRSAEREIALQIVLAGAFYPNYFMKRHQDDRTNGIQRALGCLNPTKTVYLRGWPLNHSGIPYARRFQQIVSRQQGIPAKQIMVSFDSMSKYVYLQYRKRDTPGDESLRRISPFVYQSVKMRQCDVPIRIELLCQAEANSRSRSYDVCKYERNVFYNRSARSDRGDDDGGCHVLPRPELPELGVTLVPLVIQHIVSPGYFWASYNDERTNAMRKTITRVLNAESLRELHSRPDNKTLIAAPINANDRVAYRRGLVKAYETEVDEVADVFFVDHGFTARLRLSDLRTIPSGSEILKLPCLVFQCTLANVRPTGYGPNHNRQWSELAQSFFRKQVRASDEIQGEIYSVIESVVVVDLISLAQGQVRLNVNDALVKRGHAITCDESYLSRFNHDVRANVVGMSREERLYYEEQQYDQDYLLDTYPDLPHQDECETYVRLSGPYSPLEIELMQLTENGMTRKINVEAMSVNSVLLDDCPDSACGRLLVAQSVCQGNIRNNLLLRNTTYLPNIPGLAGLVALIFAPRVEIRRNTLATHYTSALCGLGPVDSHSGRSLFPDHDMVVPFDVELTIGDMQEINVLRYWMNLGLRHKTVAEEEASIIKNQNNIKAILQKIIRKNRNPQDTVEVRDFMWNQYDESAVLRPPQMPVNQHDIYSLHSTLELREKNDKLEEMLKHLLELQRLADGDVNKMGTVSTNCKLCEVEIFGMLNLRGHLYSEHHMNKEKELQTDSDWTSELMFLQN